MTTTATATSTDNITSPHQGSHGPSLSITSTVGSGHGPFSKAIVLPPRRAHRHQRQTKDREAGIVNKPAPINLSNIALADPKDGKATRVGFKILDDGRKVRVAKRSGELIDG